MAARNYKVAKTGLPTAKGLIPADELQFPFKISGTAKFRPTQVYTDGQKTYVRLPEGYRGKPTPSVIPGRSVSNKVIETKVTPDGLVMTINQYLKDFTLRLDDKSVRIQAKRGA